MQPVERYLTDIRDIRSTGGSSPETSYYGALENLLNEVGSHLKPVVRCVSQLMDTGGGKPDFGLFTTSQFQRRQDLQPLSGQVPERGVIEVKPLRDDSFITAEGDQVTKYWNQYNLVLVTNYRDFVLVGTDESGHATRLEVFRLAPDLNTFYTLLAHPHKAGNELGERFSEFLQRVMLYSAPITEPGTLAWFLASHAREAKARIEAAHDLEGLKLLKEGLAEALGLGFIGEEGEHFFRGTLVQTLFYGVFSSWVLWAQESHRVGDHFDWRTAAWNLHVPMIAGLFDQIATPAKLQPLGIDEVLDWTGAVLNRVNRETFFSKFEEEHAVQYFYEPFLKAYDPQLRKDLGVWYTPPEIVKYQVERVDTVLREELSIEDGLADPSVVVLDPCCGTGAYLVEVLRKIGETLAGKGSHALTAQELKKAAINRVFGFEIIPAPFVIAHMQIGLLLRNLGAPLKKHGDRVGVYLTNALTGWDQIDQRTGDLQHLAAFPEMEAERRAALAVKRESPVLVILGNPPYNAYAGTSPAEEAGLVDAYKVGLNTPVAAGGWGIKKFNLDDLYVRFFRIAERRIVKTGRGVVSFISNHSWVSDPSFVVLRHQLLQSFDKLWVENLHGNRKISEYAPDGKTSETVFAIPGFSPGIQQGVVTSLWVRSGERKGKLGKVFFRDDLNTARAAERRSQLLRSLLSKRFDRQYSKVVPQKSNRFSFRYYIESAGYLSWPKVTDLCAIPPFNGLMEKRGGALFDIDQSQLVERMRDYFNPDLDWDEYRMAHRALTEPQAGFCPKEVRKKALGEDIYHEDQVVRYSLRPLDQRWCYYTAVSPIWNRSRPALWAQCWKGNQFLMSRPAGVASPEGVPFFYTALLGDNDSLRGHAYYFPFKLQNGNRLGAENAATLLDLLDDTPATGQSFANLSERARFYLHDLGFPNPDRDQETANLVWYHVLSIGFSPAYRADNADGIRQDWPRIPLALSKKTLIESAALGKKIAGLLDSEVNVPGVTSGKLDPLFIRVGTISRVGGGSLIPDEGHLDLTAGWGHGGKDGVTMPGKGRIEMTSISDEMKKSWPRAYGDEVYNVFLNDVAYWANIPAPVWNYTIGGYQVIKKWLSYREKVILGRGLTLEEVHYVTEMARRIAALVLLEDELDANYQAVKSETWDWAAE